MADPLKQELENISDKLKHMYRASRRLMSKPSIKRTADENDLFEMLHAIEEFSLASLLAIEKIAKRIDSLEAKLETKKILSNLDLKSVHDEALKGATKGKFF